jgi:hypothetical protein
MSNYKLSMDYFAGLLQASMERQRAKGKIQWMGNTPLDMSQALQIAYDMFVRVIEDEMIWVKGDGTAWWVSFYKACEKHIPNWPSDDGGDESVREQLDAIYTDVFDPLFLTMSDTLDQMGIARTWDVLSFKCRLIRNLEGHVVDLTVVVENTGDYRVLDWQRRMKSGEWQRDPLPTHSETQMHEDEYASANRESLRIIRQDGALGRIVTFGK